MDEDFSQPGDDREEVDVSATNSSAARFAALAPKSEFADDRVRWDWKSKYPPEARREINFEARVLVALLAAFLLFDGLFLGLSGEAARVTIAWLPTVTNEGGTTSANYVVGFRWFALFFAGSVGGVTFSIKWLVHAVAYGRWHMDRRYWRLLVPLVGGALACVVTALMEAGMIGGAAAAADHRPVATAAAVAFLVGYFSDGVSGLLSNVANAIFGTLKNK